MRYGGQMPAHANVDLAAFQRQQQAQQGGGAMGALGGLAGKAAGLYLGKEAVPYLTGSESIGQGLTQAGDYLGGLLGSGGGAQAASNAGTSVGSALAQKGAASQAAWNSGADAATQAAARQGGSSFGGVAAAAPYLGAAAGAYGLYDLANDWGEGDRSVKGTGMGAAQGAAAGAALGSVVPGIGTLAGGIVGGAFGAASKYAKAGKHGDQKDRDNAIRNPWQQSGFIDNNYNFTLADGSQYDMGRDGSEQIYNVDFNQEGVGEAVGALNPLAVIHANAYGNGSEKIMTDTSGMLTNAALSSGDMYANARGMYEQAGLDKDGAFAQINTLKDAGKITEDEARAYHNGLNSVFGQSEGNSSGGLANSIANIKMPKKANDTGFSISKEQLNTLYG